MGDPAWQASRLDRHQAGLVSYGRDAIKKGERENVEVCNVLDTNRFILLPQLLPLAAASVVTATLAYGMSVLIFIRLAPPGTAVPQLGHVYYATMGAGLAIALIVIGATLPSLSG